MEGAQNKSFLSAIASAIKALCMLVIDLVTLAQEGVAMADKTIKTSRERQAIELDLSMSDYASAAILRASAEQAKAQEALQQYVNADNTGERKKLIESNMTRLRAAVDKGQLEIALDRKSRMF